MRVRRTAYDPKYEIDMKNLVLLGAVSNKFAKKTIIFSSAKMRD